MQKIKNRGITLSALVITIVIVLILSAVAIGALAGDNGLIKRAQNAAERANIATAQEAISLRLDRMSNRIHIASRKYRYANIFYRKH